jgi:O-antigen/teichoic acid export membrane protein
MQTICNIFVIAANAYYCLSTLKVKFKLHFWDKNFICELFFFSFFIFLAMIVNEAYWRTGQIILGAVIGTAAVAVYSITVQLASAFMSFSSAVSGVFFPHLSAISAKTDDMKPINEIFIKIGRIQFIIISLVFSGFLIYGKQFVILWIGDGFKDAYFYAVILFSALLIPVVQNTGVFILQAKNKHYFRSIALFCLAVVNIIISIPMAKKYGGLGCACVTGGCILLGQGLILNIYYSKIGIDIKSFFKNIIFMAPPALIVCLTGFAVERFFLTADVYALAGKIILFSALFFALMYKFAFNQYEKNLFLTPAFYIINRIKKAKS